MKMLRLFITAKNLCKDKFPKAKFVIIAGKKEFENNSIEIKNQITMEQKTIGLNEMISFIKKGK